MVRSEYSSTNVNVCEKWIVSRQEQTPNVFVLPNTYLEDRIQEKKKINQLMHEIDMKVNNNVRICKKKKRLQTKRQWLLVAYVKVK